MGFAWASLSFIYVAPNHYAVGIGDGKIYVHILSHGGLGIDRWNLKSIINISNPNLFKKLSDLLGNKS